MHEHGGVDEVLGPVLAREERLAEQLLDERAVPRVRDRLGVGVEVDPPVVDVRDVGGGGAEALGAQRVAAEVGVRAGVERDRGCRSAERQQARQQRDPVTHGTATTPRRSCEVNRAGTFPRMPADTYPWDRPLGARVAGDGLVEVRVWAPGDERRVTVRIARAEHELTDEGLGVRSAVVPGRPGDDYWLTLDGKRFPDPASRWQPRGLRGASRVVDHQGFSWTDDSFEGGAAARRGALRAARRHVHRRGHVRRRHPAPRGAARRWASRTSS